MAADPQIDATDLYGFVSPDKQDTVTLISNWIPFEEPAGGPNFYPWAPGVHYDISIDNNGDAKPDIVYRWVFRNHYRDKNTFLYNTGPVNSLGDATLNFYQTYKLLEIRHGHSETLLGSGISAPSDVGSASMPDYGTLSNSAIAPIENGTGQTWAGQADDPFFLDLRVFDLLYGGNFSEVGTDTLAGFNVNSLALQVPKTDVTQGGDGSGIVGIWTTAERRTTRVESTSGTVASKGPFVQVSRLGNPLVNEVVVPVGLKDYFNASQPKNDAQYLGAVQDPILPHIVDAVYNVPPPDSDPNTAGIQRADLIQVFLTGVPNLNQPPQIKPSEMLRLNTNIAPCTSSCSRLGVVGGDNAGFPDGRRLSDDIIDASLRVVEGVLLGQNKPTSDQLTDGVDQNDVGFRTTFPYLALPHSGSDPTPHS